MNTVLLDGAEITPSKVVCIGRNYVDHIAELKNEIPDSMILFAKPNSAISRELVYINEFCHFETEISFVIERGKICGVGLGFDLTERNLQAQLKAKQLPWERAKAFDKSAVFSDFIPYQGNGEGLRFELFVNQQLAQAGGYDLMLHKPLAVLEEIQSFMSLEDKDIIMTGTPKGVAAFTKGDVFEGRLYEGEQCLISASWVVG